MSSTLKNVTDYSIELDLYRQTGDICAFLHFDPYDFDPPLIISFARKFAAFEEAGFHLSNISFLELFIPSILRQFAVSRCSYEYQLSQLDGQGGGFPIMANLLLPACMAILAVLFNISFCIVTARKISMSTVCNWLLAFDSLCQIFAVLPFIENFFAFCANFVSVDYRICLVSQMLSIGSSYAAFLAVYFMSLERLLIVTMPMRMSQLSEKTLRHCSLLAILACTCFGGAINLIIFNLRLESTISYYGKFLSCSIEILTQAVNGEDYISITILGLALLNYVLIAGLIAWRRIYVPSTQTDSINNDAYTQATYRMLRSVFLISLIVLFGWLFGYVLMQQIIHRIMTPLAQIISQALFPNDWIAGNEFNINLSDWLLGLVTCVFPLTAGLNAPVLIINNSDYRKAYKKTLAPFKILCRKRTATVAAVGPLFTHHQHQ